MTMIIQAVEAGGRSVGRNFPAIEFAGKKSPDLAFSNVDRYGRITKGLQLMVVELFDKSKKLIDIV